MTGLQAISGGLGPIEHGLPRIEEKRERSRREKAFPLLDEEENPETPSSPEEKPPPPARPRQQTPDQRIDLHVHGSILPTRQEFPPAGYPETLH